MPAALPYLSQLVAPFSFYFKPGAGRGHNWVKPWLLLFLLGGAATTTQAQTTNRFVTHDDTNQVPAGTAKSGNVIPNDDNPDNLPNAAFEVKRLTPPRNGTLTSFNPDGSYVYTPNPGFVGQDSFTYQICQPGATPNCSNISTVVLNVYDSDRVCTLGTGRNLLVNPSFTDGNVGFTTAYRFVSSPAARPQLYVEGGYAVDTDALPYSFAANFRGMGRTGAGDKFMFVNGGASLDTVYSQTVTVQPNRYYLFSVYATSINGTSPAQLALVVDGKSTSVVTTLPAGRSNVGTYVRISDLYFSGPGPAGGFQVELQIRDVNKAADGNDFGIDDLYFGSCTTQLTADEKTTATVPNRPAPAPIQPLSATLDVNGSVGVTVASFTIQRLPATGVLTFNGTPVTLGQVIPVSGPGSRSSGGTLAYTPAGSICESDSTTFRYSANNSDDQGSNNIAIYTIPLGPGLPFAVQTRGANPFCEGQSVALSGGARPGYRYTWFRGTTIANGAGAVLNDSLFTATTPGSYSVKVEAPGCVATSTPLSVSTKACPLGEPEPCSFDEKFINTWYFGNKAGLNFNGQAPPAKTPAVLTDGQMVTPAGAATMSDNEGNLLFYSNGETIWTRNHTVMPNGTGLAGNALTTDGPVAIRRPGSTTRYYLFTQDARGGERGLSFSEIDMALNGGLGDIVADTKNTPLTRRTAEKMTAVLHDNGCDSWIIVHGYGEAGSADPASGSAFLAYQVTATGVITTPVVSTEGPRHAPSVAPQAFRGQMKVSPDGRQLAVARFNDGPVPANGTIELYDFDAKTGAVSNPRTLDSGEGGYYGVEFSPGRTRLYATVLSPPKLLQFDLSLDPDSIAASKTVIPTPPGGPNLGSIQAAPDGKLYVARENQPLLGVISYPDSLGAAVAYLANDTAQALGGRLSGLGLPNFNQSFLVKLGFGYEPVGCREIKFQAGTSIPDPETYEWDFAGLGKSSEKDPTFIFPAPGDYRIKLRVTKACLCKEIEAIIRVPGLPNPGSIAGPQTVCAGAAPTALSSTADASGDAGLPLVYQWESSRDDVSFTAIDGATSA
ncbi:Ig-like domain-containing protein, partial [uncultured Hymenobacter sp.]|uniref:Ig-like domain-containing protein n=1 Tax=uncultured Hymenobacter sp. TaxID=170016 RepID=UPI0035C9E1E0